MIAIGLGFSFSRGAWLATSLGGGVLLLRARRWQPLALAVALFGALFRLPAVRERAQSAGSVDKADVTMADLRDGTRVVQLRNTVPLRLRNMGAALELLADRPITGGGAGYFHGTDKGEDAPHNTYLRIWAESGLISLACFLGFLSLLWWRVRAASKRSSGGTAWIQASFEAIVVAQAGYLLLGDWAYQLYFWVFIGLAAAAANMRLRNAAQVS